MKSKTKGLFWGLVFIAAAALIVLSSLDVVHIGAYTVVMTIIFGAIFLGSLTDVQFTGMLFAASHLVQVYRQYIPISDKISGWTLIIASLLLGIGLDIIFSRPKKAIKQKIKNKKKAKKMNKHGFQWNTDGDGQEIIFDTNIHDSDDIDDQDTSTSSTGFSGGSTTMAGKKINIENAFGERSKYITSEDFVEANIENGFGTLNVYFDNVKMLGTQAAINVDNGFGKTNVYLPASWRLSLDDDAGFGKIKVKGSPSMNSEAPLIYVNASTGFGDITLYFG